MLRRSREEGELRALVDRAIAEMTAGSAETGLELLRQARSTSAEAAAAVDRALVERIARLQNGLEEASEQIQLCRDILKKLTAKPWHPAILLDRAETPDGPCALVAQGSVQRSLGFAEGLDPQTFEPGDRVLLSSEQNVILDRSPYDTWPALETARYERTLPDGRLLLNWRDEQVLVGAARAVADLTLKAGDLVTWDRGVGLAFGVIDRTESTHRFLEDTPPEGFDAIGGLDDEIRRVQRAVLAHRRNPELWAKYGRRPTRSILLVGPPGNGKTMLARALANWLAGLSRSGRSRFMNVKPASLHSMWYSQSEANYREVFRVAREVGAADPDVPVIMFFDEVDAVGSTRGESVHRIDDRVLTAFATELDGLEARGNILVVAATNRRSALDPALDRPGRLGDLIIDVPRPNSRAARSIFEKGLPTYAPYETRPGQDPLEARAAVIDVAIAAIYSPNGSVLATLKFRDGSRRTIGGRDLISGALIAKIADLALGHRYDIHEETGEGGVRPADMLSAVTETLDDAARVLTPASCRHHLTGLPQDTDVVDVEFPSTLVRNPYRYVNAA